MQYIFFSDFLSFLLHIMYTFLSLLYISLHLHSYILRFILILWNYFSISITLFIIYIFFFRFYSAYDCNIFQSIFLINLSVSSLNIFISFRFSYYYIFLIIITNVTLKRYINLFYFFTYYTSFVYYVILVSFTLTRRFHLSLHYSLFN